MKKLLTVLLLTASTTVFAGPYYGHGIRYHGYWHGGHNAWIAPAIVGGVVTYVLTRPQPAPVIVEQQPVIVQSAQTCTEWREVQTPEGKTYRERTCYGVQR
jgi:hypothetical protein